MLKNDLIRFHNVTTAIVLSLQLFVFNNSGPLSNIFLTINRYKKAALVENKQREKQRGWNYCVFKINHYFVLGSHFQKGMYL